MQILNIKAENFKGIKLIEIQPEPTTTIVGGKNRQGKSSLLDATAATLGGAKLSPKRPIRDGEDSASCTIKLDGDQSKMLPPCTVTRKWRRTKAGNIASDLTIVTDDGFRAPTPQTVLDQIVGKLGFDPERFLRMTAKEQAEILRGLVGLDFRQLDADRQKAFDERTIVNRNGKAMKARLDAMPGHPDAPEKEVSVSALMTELQRRQAVNRRNGVIEGELVALQKELEDSERAITSAADKIQEMKRQLKFAESQLKDCQKAKATNTGDINVKSVEVNSLKDEDETEIEAQIAESESVNRKVRENVARAKLEAEVNAERAKSEALTSQITQIDAQKQKMREETQWPVDGLGYDEDGVTLFDRPFEQASATEQRQAAFGIVAALNPTLKFAMIKDGSLLDDEALADFSRIAAEGGFQLFIERVGSDDNCTVVISNGEVLAEKEDE